MNAGFMPQNYKWHFLAHIWQTPLLGEFFQMFSNKAAFKIALNMANPKPLPNEFIETMYSFQDKIHKAAILTLYRSMKNIAKDERAKLASAALNDSKVPILVIWGEKDIYLPIEFGRHQIEILENAKMISLKNCGHWPFIDEPEMVAGHLNAWIKLILLKENI